MLEPLEAGIAAIRAEVATSTAEVSTGNNEHAVELAILQPVIRVLPSVGPPGQVVLAYGENMPPASKVSLAWTPGISVHPGPFEVADDGTVRVPILIVRNDRIGTRLLAATSTDGPVHAGGRGDARRPRNPDAAQLQRKGLTMIAQVDDALHEIVTGEALRRRHDLDVVFDAPTKDWAARRNAPTVNLYLYDIREDLRRRPAGYLEERDPDSGQVVMRRPAPAVLQAVLPGDGVDPASRGRAPAARQPAAHVPEVRRAARPPGRRSAGRDRASRSRSPSACRRRRTGPSPTSGRRSVAS